MNKMTNQSSGLHPKKPTARPLLGPRPADALALGAGLLMPFSFAPFGLYGLGIIGLALLFAVLPGAAPWRGFWRGWLFGLGMFGVGVSWIHESFQFAAVALPLALVMTGGLVMFLALYPALFGFLVSRLARLREPHTGSSRSWSMALLVLPAGWVLQEWLRGWLFTGFPWLQVGYAHMDSPLAGFAPLLGVYGVGWADALSAGLLLLAFGIILHSPSSHAPKIRGLLVLSAMGAALWGGAAALDRVAWTTPTGARATVALIQGNIPQDVKWRPEQQQPTLERYLSLTWRERDRNLVVWPETALPGFYDEFPNTIARLHEQAQAHGSHVLLGAPTREPALRRYFNSMVAITGEGEPEAFYHKKHLVPFGEYLPMGELLRGVLDFLRIPMSNFSPGPSGQALLRAAGQEIGASICYEAAFGRDILASLPRASLLVNISNDAWFGDSLGPHQNLQMARMRAKESGRYLLRATNTGISALMDPAGRVVERARQFETAVLTGAVTGMTGATPYVQILYGDGLVALLALVAFMAGCLLPLGLLGGSSWGHRHPGGSSRKGP